jgi:hypothetical protein
MPAIGQDKAGKKSWRPSPHLQHVSPLKEKELHPHLLGKL